MPGFYRTFYKLLNELNLHIYVWEGDSRLTERVELLYGAETADHQVTKGGRQKHLFIG